MAEKSIIFSADEIKEMSVTDAYLLLDSLAKKGILRYCYELWCSKCQKYCGNVSVFKELGYYFECENCGERLLGLENSVLVYKVVNTTKSVQTLFTIGYEGRNIDGFINTLVQNGVKLLCDIRKNPISRKFGFSKGKLGHITAAAGIRYVHIPELGIGSDKRNSLKTMEDYANLFSEYEKTLPNLESYLEQVYLLLRDNDRIALMCYEKEADMCHRHVVRDYIKNMYDVRSEDL